MPQAAPELRARWTEGSSFCYLSGVVRVSTGGILYPTYKGYEFSDTELDAIQYLCDEWDYAFMYEGSPNPAIYPQLEIEDVDMSAASTNRQEDEMQGPNLMDLFEKVAGYSEKDFHTNKNGGYSNPQVASAFRMFLLGHLCGSDGINKAEDLD